MEASAASSPRPRSCRLLRFFPNGASMLAASPVPDRILAKLAAIKPRETYITSFEIMALCGVHFSIPYDQIRGAVFLHFGDNSGANFSSLKGSSPFPDAALMISAYNLQLARAGARSWIDNVPSKLNLAEYPSGPPFATASVPPKSSSCPRRSPTGQHGELATDVSST